MDTRSWFNHKRLLGTTTTRGLLRLTCLKFEELIEGLEKGSRGLDFLEVSNL